MAADGDDALCGGCAPAGGELEVETLHGGMGAGEVAIADIVERHDGGRQAGGRQEGDDVGGHEQDVRRAAAELPGEGAVGPEAVARQRADGDGALVVRGRGGAAHRFGRGLFRRVKAEGKAIAGRGEHVTDDLAGIEFGSGGFGPEAAGGVDADG